MEYIKTFEECKNTFRCFYKKNPLLSSWKRMYELSKNTGAQWIKCCFSKKEKIMVIICFPEYCQFSKCEGGNECFIDPCVSKYCDFKEQKDSEFYVIINNLTNKNHDVGIAYYLETMTDVIKIKGIKDTHIFQMQPKMGVNESIQVINHKYTKNEYAQDGYICLNLFAVKDITENQRIMSKIKQKEDIKTISEKPIIQVVIRL